MKNKRWLSNLINLQTTPMCANPNADNDLIKATHLGKGTNKNNVYE